MMHIWREDNVDALAAGEPVGVRDDHAAHLQAAEVQGGLGRRGRPLLAPRPGHRYAHTHTHACGKH